MELLTNIIGYAAAAIGTSLMLPQVYKSFKTKRVADLSMTMVIVYIINCLLWGIYGLLIKSNPIIICNIVALGIGFLQLILKLKYSNINDTSLNS